MIVLACEGNSEVYLLRSLIEKGMIVFDSQIFMDGPIYARQIQRYKALLLTVPTTEEIIVYRIGDTLTDELDLRGFEARSITVKKICTKPEIELLIIIQEGLLNAFEKSKSFIRPKEFIKMHRPKIDIKDYFNEHDMSESIRKYKQIKKHSKGLGYLADLLKQ